MKKLLIAAMLFCSNAFATDVGIITSSTNTCYSDNSNLKNIITLTSQSINYRGTEYFIAGVQKFDNGGVMYIFMNDSRSMLIGIVPKRNGSSDYAIINSSGKDIDSGYCVK